MKRTGQLLFAALALFALARASVHGAAPPAPTLLTNIVNTCPEVDLRWNDNSSNETGFEVQRAVQPTPTSFAFIGKVPGGSGATKIYQDFTPALCVTNYWRVRAFTNVFASVPPATQGTSAWSNVAFYFNGPCTGCTTSGPPTAPTSVLLSQVACDCHTLKLTWVDQASNEQGFWVQRALNGTFSSGLTSNSVAASPGTGLTVTYFASGLATNTAYFFRVAAYSNTLISAFVNSVPASTNTKPCNQTVFSNPCP